MDDLVTRVCYRERYGIPTLQDETDVKKKTRSVKQSGRTHGLLHW
jgi:hypothetical protein